MAPVGNYVLENRSATTMRTILRTTLIAVKILTVPVAAGLVDPQPQPGPSLIATENRLDNDNATVSTGRSEPGIRIPNSGSLQRVIYGAVCPNRLRHQVKARIPNGESGGIAAVLPIGWSLAS
jgi:hypothetical protein